MWNRSLITRWRSYFNRRVLIPSVGSLDKLDGAPRRLCCTTSAACFSSTTETSNLLAARRWTEPHCPISLSATQSEMDFLITKCLTGSSVDDILESLMCDEACAQISMSHCLVDRLLRRFKDDWKPALGFFRWAMSCPGFRHTQEAYDVMVDILGKARKFGKMRELIDEMRQSNLVTLKTVAKMLRRYSGAEQWEEAVRTFDKLGDYGLQKNTESMNLLLDTICKEKRVEQAREIFLELKAHVQPDAHTFNIFIHGWCKINRVEEAHWTIQEMKGYGLRPCVISYTTIMKSYCEQSDFTKVHELIDEMEAQGCPPNAVSYTSVICWLTKFEEYDEAVKIAQRSIRTGCQVDTLFYNSYIHALGRAGQIQEAVDVFEVEMPKSSISPTTSTYNTMICMFCRNGYQQKALELLKDMGRSPFCKPDLQSYHPLLKSCFKLGEIDSYLRVLLDSIANEHHLSLDLATYTLLIHGLCQADRCSWAYLLFEDMIAQELTPKYRTCRLLLDEVKLKSMYDAAERVEVYMKQMKKF
ncbi:Pentatricopeptide repeat-containing protein [Drosera capensis]